MVTIARILPIFELSAILGCGLIAGVFFAFSTFIMPAFALLEPKQGIATMQYINIKAINPLFMTAFFGTAIVCFSMAIYSLSNWHQSNAIYLFTGSLLYLFGTVGVTIAFNVPLNNALAIAKIENAEDIDWNEYLINWTFWNHVRTVAALIATVLFAIAAFI